MTSVAQAIVFSESLRKEALARFRDLGLPTVKDEDWQYTDVSAISKLPLEPRKVAGKKWSLADLDKLSFAKLGGSRLVFLNGKFQADLSSPSSFPSAVICGSLAKALQTHKALIEKHLTQYATWENQAFVALNTGYFQDGAFIHVPKGISLAEPVHLFFLSDQDGASSHVRNLILAEPQSQVSVIEHYLGLDGKDYFTNAVTEIWVGERASVEHYKLQEEGANAYHVATIQASQERDSRFHSVSLSLGARLARNDINSVLEGPGGECAMDGLYLGSKNQHVDHHTSIDHADPNCQSRELYKGILDGHAKAVFNGKIIVGPNAQKTDAIQTNKNLLLSADAEIDTKPQLEIFADDVKCKHGATVGRLDENAIFYLRSRGMDLPRARALLTYAFASEVVGKVKAKRLQAKLDEYLFGRFGE